MSECSVNGRRVCQGRLWNWSVQLLRRCTRKRLILCTLMPAARDVDNTTTAGSDCFRTWSHTVSCGTNVVNEAMIWIAVHTLQYSVNVMCVSVSSLLLLTFLFLLLCLLFLPSVLWCCWVGVRKSIWPVKKLSDEVLAWLSIRIRDANDLHMVQLMPLPPIASLHWNPGWFNLSGAGLPRLSWKRGC